MYYNLYFFQLIIEVVISELPNFNNQRMTNNRLLQIMETIIGANLFLIHLYTNQQHPYQSANTVIELIASASLLSTHEILYAYILL